MSELAIKVFNNYVIIKPHIVEKTESGMVLLPETAYRNQSEAVVVAVGEGTYLQNGDLIPVGVEVGDRIQYQQHQAQEINVRGEKLFILPSTGILFKFLE